MGLIVVTIKHWLLVLQDWMGLNVAFNKLLCEGKYFLIVSLMGVKICLMRHVLTCHEVLLAHEHLTVVTFVSGFTFQVHICVYGLHSRFVIQLDVA